MSHALNTQPKKHPPRKSLRLPGYDYRSSGAYSVTACTKDRKPFFNILALREILEVQWVDLPQHFAGIKPDTLVIMPNHIHCILWLDANVEGSPSLGDVIGAYKSLSNGEWLRYMKKEAITGDGKIWQRSFHDHIVRNALDFNEKQTYILNNPLVWDFKDEHKNV